MIPSPNVIFGGILCAFVLTLSGCNNEYTPPPRLKIANIREGEVISGRFRVFAQSDPPLRSEFYCMIDDYTEQEWFELGSALNRNVGGSEQLGVEMDSAQLPNGKHILSLADINGVMDKRTVYVKNNRSTLRR